MPEKRLVAYITDKFSRPLNKFFLKSYLLTGKNGYEFLEYDDVCCLKEAGLLINKLIADLPEGSILFSLVQEKIDKQRSLLYVKIGNKHIFLPDNGTLGYIYAYDKSKYEVYEVNPAFFEKTTELWKTFLLLVEAVEKKRITELCTKKDEVKVFRMSKPQRQINSFTSKILFFTRSGSAVLDLTEEMFLEKAGNYSSYRILIKDEMLVIKKIDNFISENKEIGEPYAIFNEYGHLEVGIFMESIQKMYSLTENNVVKIEFYE